MTEPGSLLLRRVRERPPDGVGNLTTTLPHPSPPSSHVCAVKSKLPTEAWEHRDMLAKAIEWVTFQNLPSLC